MIGGEAEVVGAEGMGRFQNLGDFKVRCGCGVDFDIWRAGAGDDLGGGCRESKDVGCVGWKAGLDYRIKAGRVNFPSSIECWARYCFDYGRFDVSVRKGECGELGLP